MAILDQRKKGKKTKVFKTIAERDATMKADYISSDLSITAIAELYGMSESNARIIAKKDLWVKSRKAFKTSVEEDAKKHVIKTIKDTTTMINSRHYQTWAKMLNMIDAILDDARKQLQYANGDYKLGKLEVVAKIMLMIQEGQRMSKGIVDGVEGKKLDIAFKRLDLEARKLIGDPEPPVSDNFDEVLAKSAEAVWLTGGDVDIDGEEEFTE